MALHDVPREALWVGLAGVLPYLGTSLSTVYLAYDLNHSKVHGFGVLLDADQAVLGLQIMEPLQIGYGAVVRIRALLNFPFHSGAAAYMHCQILSFLGAIHWGLEWANYNGSYPWDRYRIGLLCPAIAWPTLLMPVEYALITQFLTFTYLYFHDAEAALKGTVPEWYNMYRFVLTFIVGASIVLSLVGRGQIAEYTMSPGRPTDIVHEYAARRQELLDQEAREMAEARARGEKVPTLGDEEDEEDEEEEEEDDDE